MKTVVKIKKIGLIDLITILYIFSIYFSSVGDYRLQTILFITWIFFVVTNDKKYLKKIIFCKNWLPILLFLMVYFLYALLTTSVISAIKMLRIQILSQISGAILFRYYVNKKMKTVFLLSKFSVIIVAVAMLTMMYFYNIYNTAGRYLIQSQNPLYNTLIGSPYGIAVAAAMISVTMIGFIVNRSVILSKSIITKYIIFIALTSLYLVRTESTIYLLLFVVVSIIALILRSASKIGKILSILLLCVIFVFFLVYIEDISYLIINFGNSLTGIVDDKMISRIKDIGNYLLYGEGTTFKNRIIVYENGIEQFLLNPLFGNGYKNGISYSTVNASGHSEWIDLLCRFGVFGFVLYFIYLIRHRVYEKNENGIYSYGFYFIFFITCGLLNQIYLTPSWIAYFFIVPIFTASVLQKRASNSVERVKYCENFAYNVR